MNIISVFKKLFSNTKDVAADVCTTSDVSINTEQKITPTPAPTPVRKPYIGEIQEIYLSKLPYEPIPDQIIYVETEYNEEVNAFIKKNIKQICRFFKKNGYEFCYLPYIVGEIRENHTYYAPQQDSIGGMGITSSYLLNNVSTVIKPSLLYYSSNFKSSDNSSEPIFKVVTIDLTQDVGDNFDGILRVIMRDISASAASAIKYSLPDPTFDSFMGGLDLGRRPYKSVRKFVEAEYPDDETMRLISEIEERVQLLEQRGIGKHILQQIISSPGEISRMVITRDYRIILPDYNNMEIEMTPLVKAIYILFLRHPEGIIFKDLDDYRKELTNIYQQIKGERLNLKMRRSIADITNPTNNSINEKIARIREAFVTRFNKALAMNYIVQGGRGEAKRIPLHREFVEWQ